MLEKLYYMLPMNKIKSLVFPVTESTVIGNNINVKIKNTIGQEDLPKEIKDKKMIIDELIIPEGVIEIKDGAFKECKIKKVILPSSLKRIGYSAFSYNPFLEEVIFKDGLEFIGLYAFAATGLKKVEIPDSVQTIQTSAFERCKNLSMIKLPRNLRVMEEYLISGTAITSIDIPETINEIRYSVFWNCQKLKKVTFPNKLEKVGSSLFSYSGVKHIYLNNNIKEINNDLFKYNKIMKSVTIEFPNKRGEIQKYKIKKGLSPFNYIEKTKDGVILNSRPIFINKDLKLTNLHVITKDGYHHFTTSNLFKLTNNKQVFKENIYKGSEIKLIKWIDAMEKRKKGGQDVLLPAPYIVENYPQNIKDIVRYFITESDYDKLVNKFNLSKNSNNSPFLKMCFALGLFSDNKEESERSFKFINDKIYKKLAINDINVMFSGIGKDQVYNREFAKFYIENFEDKNTFGTNGFDVTSKMIMLFKEIADSIKNQKRKITVEEVVRYLSNQKYDYRVGNEMLAITVSNYSEYYDQNQFNKLQDIFEQGKELTKTTGKYISQTRDKENIKASYFWSPSDNPINLVLGHNDKASCCAKLGGAGQGIMKAAIISPEVQNLIIFDRSRNIIGKGTAFYNVDGKYMVFNNAEINTTWMIHAKESEKEEVLDAFLRAAKDQVNALNAKSEAPVITKIHMGMRLNDLKDYIEKRKLKIVKDGLLQNYNYEHYAGDANTPAGQVVLYEIEGGKKK